MQKIKPLTRGDVRTLLDADTANELIGAINALLSLQVKPEAAGRLTLGDTNAILDLSPLLEKLIDEKIDAKVRSMLAGATVGGTCDGSNINVDITIP